MSARNGYASFVKLRKSALDKRRPLDDYESSEDVTLRLLRRIKLKGGIPVGRRRSSRLFADTPPSDIIAIPERIRFLVDGEPIDSQFFNHCWLCWPDRETRELGCYATEFVWMKKESTDG